MTKRRNENANSDISDQLKPLIDDDAFLTSLSRGVDPSDGEDELAQLLLELRKDINGQMPPAPVIEGAEESSGEVAEADSEEGAEAAPENRSERGGATVVPIGSASNTRRVNPWLAGFVGAAASAVVVVGSGAALYNATPGSALWPVSSAIYGDRTAVVELAGTLEEMQTATDQGDEPRARELLNQARTIVGGMQEVADPAAAEPRTTQSKGSGTSETVTVTVTETPRNPASSSSNGTAPAVNEPSVATVTETVAPAPGTPATVTQTQTQTQVQTVYVEAPVRENPLPSTSAPVEVPPQTPAAPVAPQQY
ncbi:hypothetical protein ACXZ66_03105 [Corynebacterium sp. S7]